MKYLLYVFLAFALISCTQQESGNIIARAGKNTLMLEDAEKNLNAMAAEANIETIVNRWLDEEVLYLAALEMNYQDDSKIKSALENYKKRLVGRAYLNSHVQKRIQIKAAEIEKYYKKNINSYKRRFDQALILHFLVQTKKESQDIRAELKKNGTKISNRQLKDKYSVRPETVTRNKLIPELNRAVFNNQNVKLPRPVKTEAGYHVVQILKRHSAGSAKELIEVYDEIQQRLVRNKSILITEALLDSLKHVFNAKSFLEKNQ
ncbi:MAG: peptidyl-prolyl cis-trans isomerase [Candidatus Neomarinimicrobiota bacterium]